MESPDQRRNRNSRGPGTLRPTRRNRNSRGPGTLRPTRRDRSVSMESPDQRRSRTPGPDNRDRHAGPGTSQWRAPTNAATGQPGPTCRSRNRMTGWPLPEQPQPECRGPETMLPEGRSPLPRRRSKNGRNGVRSRTKPVEGEPRGRSDRPEREKTENRSDFFRFGGTEFVHLFLILPQHPDKPRAYSVS